MGHLKQAKVVHWEDGVPSTPSPTFSGSSLPSSPALSTPPQQPWRDLPPSTANSGCVRINPLLGVAASPDLIYDVSKPPTTVLPRDRTIKANLLTERATYPSLPTLTIQCPGLPWPIMVTPHPQLGYITVANVIEAIYASLRIQVTPSEFNDIPSKAQQDAVANTYRWRCSQLRDPAARNVEVTKGVRRVDFLYGRSRLMGLKATAKGPSDWELCVS